MKKALGLSLVALPLVITLLAGRAVSQAPFPDEPGRDTMLLACSQCHSAGKMLSVKLDAEEWEFIVYDMLARGANVHADDVEMVLDYIQRNFATDKDGKE